MSLDCWQIWYLSPKLMENVEYRLQRIDEKIEKLEQK
jgi:hypothetical protein